MDAFRVEIFSRSLPEPRVLTLRGVDRADAEACVAAIETAVHNARAAQSSVALILDFAPGQDLTVPCDDFEGVRIAD